MLLETHTIKLSVAIHIYAYYTEYQNRPNPP